LKIIKSVNKALNILELFQKYKGEMTLGEIAGALEIDKTTVNSLALTLVKQGFLKQRKKRGKYSLGMKLLDIVGSNYNAFETKNTAIPYILVELGRLVNESVSFTVWYGSGVLLSRSLVNGESLDTIPADWDSAGLHQTCVGKIILANMSNDDLNRYFRRKTLSKNTSDLNIDIEQMKKQLAVVKRKGLAFEDEEHQLAVSGVAAGVKNSEGETIGAVHVMGPSVRLTHTVLERIAPSVQRCALKISIELGYSE
jgi:IclR family transcriptional regulator, KDG regulon repressor